MYKYYSSRWLAAFVERSEAPVISSARRPGGMGAGPHDKK